MMNTASRTLVVVAALALLGLAVATTQLGNDTFDLFEANPTLRIAQMKEGTYNPYREFNSWVNELFYGLFKLDHIPTKLYAAYGPEAGYYLTTYIRDLAAGIVVYWGTASLWSLMIYSVLGKKIFSDKGREFPTFATFFDQMALANFSLPVYASLPLLSEWFIENKMTRVYFYIDEVGGWGNYVLYLAIYMFFVEIGVYWVHRTLHENKTLFKYVHALHHKYNKDTAMTPWCSIAFNPIDGMLQASPYVVFMFLVPIHFYTHVFLLFFTGVWATNIHDSVPGDSEPIMGAKYHTVHHTHYHYNYGQFFIFCDKFWGTLRLPKEKEDEAHEAAAKVTAKKMK